MVDVASSEAMALVVELGRQELVYLLFALIYFLCW
jgi:hypothetical protein